jgi:hypothetical protein
MQKCIECMYCMVQAGTHEPTTHYCKHPANTSPIDGILKSVLCEDMRAPTGACAREGRLFQARAMDEPKESAFRPS